MTARQKLTEQLKEDKMTSISVGNTIFIFPEAQKAEFEKKAIKMMEQGDERKNKDGTTTRREFDQIMIKPEVEVYEGQRDYIWDKTGNKVKTIVWEEVWKDGERLSKTVIRTIWKKF